MNICGVISSGFLMMLVCGLKVLISIVYIGISIVIVMMLRMIYWIVLMVRVGWLCVCFISWLFFVWCGVVLV